MDVAKYISTIEKSLQYLKAKEGSLDLSSIKYYNGESKRGDLIEDGVYVRKSEVISTYALYDDLGEMRSYTKHDKQWKRDLFRNSWIIFIYNRNNDAYDDRIWQFIYKEIRVKFKDCIDKSKHLSWAVMLATTCEIIHHEVKDESMDWWYNEMIWYIECLKTDNKKKSNRSFKLYFDKEYYDDNHIFACKNGLQRHRKLESNKMKQWFKEIFPQCKTRDEVIKRMTEKIGSDFSLSCYKKYKAEMFKGENKEHKEHKEHKKSLKQMNKENTKINEAAEKIMKSREQFGDRWQKYSEKSLVMYYKRNYEKIEEIIKVLQFGCEIKGTKSSKVDCVTKVQ